MRWRPLHHPQGFAMNRLSICLLLAASALPLLAADTAPAPAPGTAPDNSGVNVRDREDATATPEEQGDVKVIAEARRAITKDDTISTNGHNVKIVIAGGVATLRGPVKDQAEKTKIAAIVAKVAGITKVDNQLEITAN